jgi:WD40 repeat protein
MGMTLQGHDNLVLAVSFAPSGQLMLSAGGHEVRLWNPVRGEQVGALTGFSVPVHHAAFLAAQNLFAAADNGDGIVRVVYAGNLSELRQLRSHQLAFVRAMVFAPDGQSLATGQSVRGEVCVWDFNTGACLHKFRGHTMGINALAYSSDSSLIAACSCDHSASIWDWRKGVRKWQLDGHEDWVTGAAFSRDAALVATASLDKSVKVWNVERGSLGFVLHGDSGIHTVAISPDGNWIAGGSTSGLVRLWDTQRGNTSLDLLGHAGPVRCVAFSPDGKLLASGGDDRTVRIWDVP